MRYIREYEAYKRVCRVNMKVGDYVLINTRTVDISARYNSEYLEFLGSCIGQIIDIGNVQGDAENVQVEFDKPWNPPDNFNMGREKSNLPDKCPLKFSDIEFCSPDKEEIRYKLDAKKYNL